MVDSRAFHDEDLAETVVDFDRENEVAVLYDVERRVDEGFVKVEDERFLANVGLALFSTYDAELYFVFSFFVLGIHWLRVLLSLRNLSNYFSQFHFRLTFLTLLFRGRPMRKLFHSFVN